MSSTETGTGTGTGIDTETDEGTNGNAVTDATTFLIDEGTRKIIVSLILVLFGVLSLIMNIGWLVMFGFVKHLRTRPNYLLVSIAVADILSVFFWLLPALVSAAQWSWTLGEEFCNFQGFASVLFYGVNIFTLLAIALERLMKFWSPSRHKGTFTKTITLILVFSLWMFSIVFAMMPLIGWGEYNYIDPRYHCVMDFSSSYSLLQFFSITAYFIPLVLGIIFFILTFAKIAKAKRKLTPVGDAILEDRTDRPKESYAEKLQRQEEKYKNVGNKKKKPQMAKTDMKNEENQPILASNVDDDGYGSDPHGTTQAAPQTDNLNEDMDTDGSDTEWLDNDEEEYFLDYTDGIRKKRELERRTRQKRLFKLHRRDANITVTIAVIWAIYMALWLPFNILNFIWVYDYAPGYSSKALHVAIVTVTFFGAAFKPLVYLTNSYMRKAMIREVKQRRFRKRALKHRQTAN